MRLPPRSSSYGPSENIERDHDDYNFEVAQLSMKFIMLINEPRHEKTNILVSDLLRHKPSYIATEDG